MSTELASDSCGKQQAGSEGEALHLRHLNSFRMRGGASLVAGRADVDPIDVSDVRLIQSGEIWIWKHKCDGALLRFLLQFHR